MAFHLRHCREHFMTNMSSWYLKRLPVEKDLSYRKHLNYACACFLRAWVLKWTLDLKVFLQSSHWYFSLEELMGVTATICSCYSLTRVTFWFSKLILSSGGLPDTERKLSACILLPDSRGVPSTAIICDFIIWNGKKYKYNLQFKGKLG